MHKITIQHKGNKQYAMKSYAQGKLIEKKMISGDMAMMKQVASLIVGGYSVTKGKNIAVFIKQ